jgi:hypothetical protein
LAYLVKFETKTDQRGFLTVIEKELPFSIKRVFYIYGVNNSARGGHRHKKTVLAMIALNGSCRVHVASGAEQKIYSLCRPDEGLVLQPQDYHTMTDFTAGTVLLVLASEYFDPDDYVYEEYC